jgi:UDP-N-acetylglucosamine 1-carboxyvinyltransferase
MGAEITYDSSDGFFHATTDGLAGTTVTFDKVTHTGTEAVILAAVMAKGKTIIENAALEMEVDDLIHLLNQMGANIHREGSSIIISGVEHLHGTEYTIMPDRNEEVTWAIAAVVTGGEITVRNSERRHLISFLDPFKKAGGEVIEHDNTTTTYKAGSSLHPIDIETKPHPGFMTDWQAPWALLMTQAHGASTVHETVFESRFSYVTHLQKMGAEIEFFEPNIEYPESLYNFNWEDRIEGTSQGIRISGPTTLHNAVVDIDDIRAGATLIIAAVAAEGESYIYRAETVDRGYEAIEDRFRKLGADITREEEDTYE